MKHIAMFVTCLLLVGCASVPPAPDVDPNAVGLKEGEMLLLTSDQGTALIAFTNFADQEGVSTYRWRFLPTTGGKEESGNGEVFEKYERKHTGFGKYDLKDVGSQLIVTAGPFRLEWSYSSPDAGWLYPDKTNVKATVLPDSQFDSRKLNE